MHVHNSPPNLPSHVLVLQISLSASNTAAASSMMTGHDVVDSDGTLTEFYEFRHLTFQEYLTAKAVVEAGILTATRKVTRSSLC